MPMATNPSMGNQDWGSGHRNLQIEKVENGYVVKARFYKQRRAQAGDYDSAEWREFVFYEIAELIDWVRHYLEADAKVIGKPD